MRKSESKNVIIEIDERYTKHVAVSAHSSRPNTPPFAPAPSAFFHAKNAETTVVQKKQSLKCGCTCIIS